MNTCSPSSRLALLRGAPRSAAGGRRLARLIALLALLAAAGASRADEVRFFRLIGPTDTTFTAFTTDGYMTWTSSANSSTCTVQTPSSIVNPASWVEYIQVRASNPVVTCRLLDPNVPDDRAFIPAGSFLMGDGLDEGASPERPAHALHVSAFYMDRTEVTKALWDMVRAWALTNGYGFDSAGVGKAGDHPALNMSWYDSLKWCNARSQMAGLTPCYHTDTGLTSVYKGGQLVPYVKWNANGYRLPTEAEWEKAARGGAARRRFPWPETNTITHGRANYYSAEGVPGDISPTRGYHPAYATGDTPYTSPVGSFAPNGYGLYDMAGNAGEWCWDSYLENWYSNPAASSDDAFYNYPYVGGYRVFRGGMWNNYASLARCSSRGWGAETPIDGVGFRCARRP